VKDFVVSPQNIDYMALTRDGKVYFWGGHLSEPYAPIEIVYPEKITTIFQGEGTLYAAGQENMYIVESTWIQEGMKSEEFPQKVNYRYTGTE